MQKCSQCGRYLYGGMGHACKPIQETLAEVLRTLPPIGKAA